MSQITRFSDTVWASHVPIFTPTHSATPLDTIPELPDDAPDSAPFASKVEQIRHELDHAQQLLQRAEQAVAAMSHQEEPEDVSMENLEQDLESMEIDHGRIITAADLAYLPDDEGQETVLRDLYKQRVEDLLEELRIAEAELANNQQVD